MSVPDSAFDVRITRWKWLWATWLLLFGLISVQPWARHLEYARLHHPDLWVLFVIALVVVCLVLPVVYQRTFRTKLWRYEPLLVTAAVLVAGLLYNPRATLVVSGLSVTAYALGRTAIERCGIRSESPALRILSYMLTGFSLVLLVALALGSVGKLQGPWVAGACGLGIVVGARYVPGLFTDLKVLWLRWRTAQELGGSLAGLAVVAAAGFILTALLPILAPSIAFDALKFHLPAAEVYARTGWVRPLAVETYSEGPQGFEVLAACAWSLGGQAAAQLVHPLFWALSLLAGASLARNWGASRDAVVIGLTLGLAVPYAHWTGAVAKNDWMVAAYLLGTLSAYLEWRRTSHFRWLMLGAFWAGVAAAVKYTAFLGLAPLGLLYLLAVRKHSNPLGALCLLAIVFGPLGLYWSVRNTVRFGNPIYPHRLNEPVPPKSRVASFYGPQGLPRRLVLTPWAVHFRGRGTSAETRNPLGLALVFTLPLWWLLRRSSQRPELRAVAWFCGLSLLLATLIFPQIRFVLAALLLLFFLTGERLAALDRFCQGWLSQLTRLALASCLALSLAIVWILEVNRPQLSLFTFRSSRAEYLRQALAPYGSLEALQRLAGPDDRILAIDNCSRLYAPFPERFSCEYIGESPEVMWEQVTRLVSSLDYQYLVLPVRPEAAALEKLSSRRYMLEPIYRDRWYVVYRTRTIGPGASPGPES